MNKQRKVIITTTYNEMGIIIDTKAEEVAQPNLQQTCNNLATDCISRSAAIDACTKVKVGAFPHDAGVNNSIKALKALPAAQPEIIRCKDCKWFGEIGCAIEIVDDSDRPNENDFCSFAERKDNG